MQGETEREEREEERGEEMRRGGEERGREEEREKKAEEEEERRGEGNKRESGREGERDEREEKEDTNMRKHHSTQAVLVDSSLVFLATRCFDEISKYCWLDCLLLPLHFLLCFRYPYLPYLASMQ